MPGASKPEGVNSLPSAASLVIIGGGISGLSAAWELQQAGLQDSLLLEAGPRAGGVLRTETADGFVMEAGPDSVLTQKTAAAELCRALGLGDDLVGCETANRGTSILRNGQLLPLPEGWQMLAPVRLWPAITTPLLSRDTKMRIALEWFRLKSPRFQGEGDESVAAFVRRHFGQEVADVIAGPLLAGVYGGDPEQLSLPAVLPRFAEMEQKGNLIRALMKSAARQKRQSTGAPMFTSLRRGMGSLADALAEQIGPERLRTGVAVQRVISEGSGFRLQIQDGRSLRTERVLLALPAWACGHLLAEMDAELAEQLESVPYASSMTVNLAFPRALELPPGFGFLVPRSEGRRVMACTFMHRKFPHRAPEGTALLRLFFGGASDPDAIAMSDDEAVELSRQELEAILGLRMRPAFTQVSRWHRAMAQYNLGHAQRVQAIRAGLERYPRLQVAGNAYQGIGIPDCIESGRQAARALLAVNADRVRV